MKTVRYIIWLIVIISCVVSMAVYSLVSFVCVLRLLLGFWQGDDMEVMTIAAIPMLVYCWTMWMRKESIMLINKIRE